MKKNPIQFQSGLSLSDFHKKYGTDQKCRRVLFNLKWPQGFVCPRCGYKRYSLIKKPCRYQCLGCRHQTSATVGTLLEHTKVALHKWFLAAYFITQSKNSISSLSLKRQIGVSYNTAWRIKMKLIKAMQLDEDTRPLSGDIQVDGTYLGGKKKGGKRGRGADKQAFVAAISTLGRKPMYAKFTTIPSFKQKDIANWARFHVQDKAHIMSDGLKGFQVFSQLGYQHTAIKTTGDKHAQDVIFRWVNTILGNVKRAIDGTYHAIRKPYMHRYLTLFQFRFNHRFNLPKMLDIVVGLMVSTPPVRLKMGLA